MGGGEDGTSAREGVAYPGEDCSLRRALAVVGERWTLIIVREALRGLRRFEDLQRATGCARNVLADRLATLVEHGVLIRVPYREAGRRERTEYRLSEKGRELSTAVIALMRWGDRHYAAPDGPPLDVVHAICGAPVRVRISCERHGLVPPGAVDVRLRGDAVPPTSLGDAAPVGSPSRRARKPV